MRALILLAVMGLMTAARTFQVAGTSLGSSTALSVGYLLLTAYLFGYVAKSLRLPKLTGYLLAGLIAGASGFDLLPHVALDDLKIFTGVAVALIALTAGTELELRSMLPLARTIAWTTVLAGLGTPLLLAAAAIVMQPWLPFMDGLDAHEVFAVALLLGVILSARSPAVVVALRSEMSADGPLCRTVLGTVVTGDLLVIVLFAIVSAFASSVFGASASAGSTFVHMIWGLLGSFVAGAGIGLILAFYLRRVAQGTPLFVLMVCFVVAEVGARIGLDPLLVALSAGILIRNVTREGEALHRAIEGSSLPVYLVFFAAAGATIHLDVLAIMGLPALVFVVLRAIGFIGGARLAARVAGAPEQVRRWLGFGLLPQAGLALALSLLLARTFPQFGEAAGTMALGVVALNELIAPVLYRWALVKSGEVGRLESPSGQHQTVDSAWSEASTAELSTEGLPVLALVEQGSNAIAEPLVVASMSHTGSASPVRSDTGSWPASSTAHSSLSQKATPAVPAAPVAAPMPPRRRITEPSLPPVVAIPARANVPSRSGDDSTDRDDSE